MGKIIVSVNVSLDGIMQDPTGEEGTSAGGWFAQVSDADRTAFGAFAHQEALDAEALLLGRRSYEWLAARWPSRTGPWAERLNAMPKYVVSSTLAEPGWNNSTVLTGSVQHRVAELKQSTGGGIVVNASGRLVRALIEHDLVDEVRLMVYPFVLGAGERLFGPTRAPKRLRRSDPRAVGDSLTLLTYQVIR